LNLNLKLDLIHQYSPANLNIQVKIINNLPVKGKQSRKNGKNKLPVFTFVKRDGILIVMKKINLFLCFFFLCMVIFPKDVLKIGAYAGYFSPADQTFKDVYHGEDVTYGLKLGVRVVNNFSLWVAVLQFKKDGETKALGDSTTLRLNPIHLTARYTFKLGIVNPYVEGGYTHIFYNEKSVIGDKTGEGKGYCLDAGLEFRMSSHFVIDIGAKYSRSTVQVDNLDVELGGIQAGATLLLVF